MIKILAIISWILCSCPAERSLPRATRASNLLKTFSYFSVVKNVPPAIIFQGQ
jgi:hypothetical protein